jgi:hypothetical protein
MLGARGSVQNQENNRMSEVLSGAEFKKQLVSGKPKWAYS